MVDGLVVRKLVARQVPSTNRRRVHLSLTARGKSAFASARQCAQAHLSARLAQLAPSERDKVSHVMQSLHPIFTPLQETD
jgi:DNA-binding MarR family transcriptional regulator